MAGLSICEDRWAVAGRHRELHRSRFELPEDRRCRPIALSGGDTNLCPRFRRRPSAKRWHAGP